VFTSREFDQETLLERLEDCVLSDAATAEDWNEYPEPFTADEQHEFTLADD
jgi:hypothetical protein